MEAECPSDERELACHEQPASVTRFSLPSAQTALGLRKPPLQRRAEVTVDAILEGAAQLLERGSSLTTNTVAERAGVSIGTLYQYFDAKEAVVAELSRKARSEMVSSVAGAIAHAGSSSLSCALPTVLTAALGAKQRRPHLALALDRLEHELDLAPDDAIVSSFLTNTFSRWLHKLHPHIGLQALRTLAEDMHAVVHALANVALSRGSGLDAPFIHRTSSALEAMVAHQARA